MATTVKYSKTSPYFNTDTFSNFLDVRRDRPIPSDPSDLLYSIDMVYTNRPDLLASDLYGDPSLWWVFAERNPNVIQDPIWDFTQGTIIYIPKKENVVAALGL